MASQIRIITDIRWMKAKNKTYSTREGGGDKIMKKQKYLRSKSAVMDKLNRAPNSNETRG